MSTQIDTDVIRVTTWFARTNWAYTRLIRIFLDDVINKSHQIVFLEFLLTERTDIKLLISWRPHTLWSRLISHTLNGRLWPHALCTRLCERPSGHLWLEKTHIRPISCVHLSLFHSRRSCRLCIIIWLAWSKWRNWGFTEWGHRGLAKRWNIRLNIRLRRRLPHR